MSYSDKLKKYKDGQLDDAEMLAVRDEIEKYNAISEFLFDEESLNDDLDMYLEGIENPNDVPLNTAEMTDGINRLIRKAFIKAGVITASIAVILSLLLAFVLPHIVSGFFYNPDSIVFTDESSGLSVNRMTKDLSVYTESRIPEYGPNLSVSVDSQGYGKYYIYMNSWFNAGEGDGDSVENGFAGMITRNNSTWYTPKAMEFESADPLTFTSGESQDLDKLDDNERYYTYVSFSRPVSYKEFLELYNTDGKLSDNDSGFIWCAVKTSDNIEGNLGFYMTDTGQSTIKYEDDSDYPLLSLNAAEEGSQYIETKEAATMHFVSMMKYLSDNEDFLNIMDGFANPKTYEDAAEYVEANGLQIYGFITTADKSHMEHIQQNKLVSSVRISRNNM